MEKFNLASDLKLKISKAIKDGLASDFSALINLALRRYFQQQNLAEKYTTRGPRHAPGTWSQDKLREQFPDISYSATELTTEVWKEIPDCPGYLISNLGRAKSRATGNEKPLKPFLQNQGYRQITIKKMGRRWQPVVHKLVAQMFVPNHTNKLEVNHKDGKHANYRACNLEWVTKEENTRHASEMGLRSRGSRYPRC